MKKKACTWMHNNRIYVLAFAAPAFLMLVVFVMAKIYPFGSRSFLHIDMYHQYFPFLTDLYHAVRGKGAGSEGTGLMYSFNAGLGTNIPALYDYYLSSPFNLLAFLVPERYLMEFFSYLAIIKIGLSGSSFCYYLAKHFDIDVVSKTKTKEGRDTALKMMLLAFSLFYAMSGFVAAYNWDLMWLDVVALSPIVILGLERLVSSSGGDTGLYTISLAVSLICNYYLCIMLCIYLVLYFLLVLLPDELYKVSKNNDSEPSSHFVLRSACRLSLSFAGSSVLAAGMAGAVLIPSALAVKMTGFADSSFPDSYRSYFSVLDMFARHLLDVAVETGLDHWPNIYASVAILILLPMYIICKKIPVRAKIGRLILLSFMFYSFSVNVLSYLWHGLNYPDSLPARQSYLYIMLLLTLCFEAINEINGYSRNEMLVAVFTALGIMILIQKFVVDDAVTDRTIALSAVAVVLYAVLICIYRIISTSDEEYAPVGSAGKRERDKQARDARMIVLVHIAFLVVMAEAGINMKLTSVPTVSRDNYLKNFSDYEKLYEENNELTNVTRLSYTTDAVTNDDADEGGLFYRFEREERLTNNDAMLKAYPSISMFSSIGNGRINDFYKRYGMRASKVFYCADGATPFMRALLGNKYVFVEDKDADLWKGMNRDSVSEVAHSGEVGLYAYENTLPVGYMVYTSDIDVRYLIDESMTDSIITSGDGLDAVERQNELALALGASGELYEPVSALIEDASADLSAPGTPGYYVAYCDTKRIDTLYVTSPSGTKEYRKLKNPYIIDLGYLNEKDPVYIDQGDTEDPVPLKMKEYRLNTEVYNDLISRLSSDVYHIADDGYGPGHLRGQIEAGAEGYMILSIPYDEGFDIYVDGAKTAAYPAMGMMTAVPLRTGKHMVELKFAPEGLAAGILVSLLSVLAFIFLRMRSVRNS